MNLAALLATLAFAADPVVFVAVAPGYPGTTAEAQASMDAFAAALAAQAGLPLGIGRRRLLREGSAGRWSGCRSRTPRSGWWRSPSS